MAWVKGSVVLVGELAGYQLPTRVSKSWDSWNKECIEVS
jgi:hypothetical protein